MDASAENVKTSDGGISPGTGAVNCETASPVWASWTEMPSDVDTATRVPFGEMIMFKGPTVSDRESGRNPKMKMHAM